MINLNGQSSPLQSSNASGSEWPAVAPDAGADGQTITQRFQLLMVSGLYLAVLLWAYAAIVSPAFAYDGMTLAWPGIMAMIWLIVLALLPSLLLPYSLSRPSAVILWWLYLSTYIPSILIPALSLSMPFEQLLPLHISLLVCMGILCWAGISRPLHSGTTTLSPTLFWLVFSLVWLGCFGYIGLNGRVALMVQNLASLFKGANEYTLRSEFRTLVEENGRGLAYALDELASALNPFLIAFGMAYRRKLCWIAGILGQIVVFGLTGFKTAIVSILFLGVVALFERRWRRSFGMAVAGGLIVAILFCAAADHVFGGVYFSSLLTRRTLLVPGLCTGFYFEHYSHVGPVGLGLHFSHNPTALTPPNEIGFVYFGSANTNANANLWGEGFAELGLPGILAFTLFTAFGIWIYDSLAAKRDLVMAALLAAMPAVVLSNTSPTTALVSHGGLVVALLLYFAPLPQPTQAFERVIEREESPSLSAAGAPV